MFIIEKNKLSRRPEKSVVLSYVGPRLTNMDLSEPKRFKIMIKFHQDIALTVQEQNAETIQEKHLSLMVSVMKILLGRSLKHLTCHHSGCQNLQKLKTLQN